MKKVLALALVMAFGFTLSACSSSAPTPAPTTPDKAMMDNGKMMDDKAMAPKTEEGAMTK